MSALDKYLSLSLHTYVWASMTLLQQAELNEKALAELASLRAERDAWKESYLKLEWVDETGECAFGCGAYASDGEHRDGCQFVELVPAALTEAQL